MRTARVLLWNTACLEPSIEAVSKELFQLRAHFRNARIFGVGPHYRLRVADGGRVVGFHHGFDPLLRLLIPIVEGWAQISHVYGETSPWIFHKTLKRRPLVLTIASEQGDLIPEFLDRCRTVVTQTQTFRQRLLDDGLPADRVTWIPPGVALDQFAPSPPPTTRRPQVLFASAPRSAEEMGPRGVNLLVETAGIAPEVDFRLLFRDWATGHTALAPTRELVGKGGLTNVELTSTAEPDMARVYPNYHFTVIPYTHPKGGKECPNSLLEGLASGRPALISSAAPFSSYVAENECGVVFDPEPKSLARAVEEGLSRWSTLSANARRVAERDFALASVMAQYEKIYANCLA